jgi:DNA-binding PadR family transcriptional regulator
MADHVLRHLFTGFVRLHILYHAAEEPICGVEIMAELRRHGYRLGPGTLYPILHQLQEARYLTSEETVVSGKRRKNFRITRRGSRLLREARQKLRELAGEVLDHRDKADA